MALRMLLVAMVVTLSLPIPDMGACQFFMTELNHEITGVFVSLRNEIPLTSSSKSNEIAVNEISQVITFSPVPATPLAVAKPDQVKSKSIESPADLAFELIQEEFAREASEFTIQEAKAALARISVKPVEHPLPPAPAAEELILPVSIFEQHETVEVFRVTSLDSDWESLSFEKVNDTYNPKELLTFEQLNSKSCLSDWSLIVAEICHEDNIWAIQEDFIAKNSVNTNDYNQLEVASESEWLAMLSTDDEFHSMITPDHDQQVRLTKPPTNEPKAVIKNAIRLTAEAIAAWSQLAAKPY